MSPVGFEPTISAGERPKTYVISPVVKQNLLRPTVCFEICWRTDTYARNHDVWWYRELNRYSTRSGHLSVCSWIILFRWRKRCLYGVWSDGSFRNYVLQYKYVVFISIRSMVDCLQTKLPVDVITSCLRYSGDTLLHYQVPHSSSRNPIQSCKTTLFRNQIMDSYWHISPFPFKVNF
jgi:hypothetical protein